MIQSSITLKTSPPYAHDVFLSFLFEKCMPFDVIIHSVLHSEKIKFFLRRESINTTWRYTVGKFVGSFGTLAKWVFHDEKKTKKSFSDSSFERWKHEAFSQLIEFTFQPATSSYMRNAWRTLSRLARVSHLVWLRIPSLTVGPSRRMLSANFAMFVARGWKRAQRCIAWVSSGSVLFSKLYQANKHYFSVCEYYAHVECQDFAIADCKENATYVPGKDLSSVKHLHHWREGNLPQSSKCAYCKKTCWSSECLTGELRQTWQRNEKNEFTITLLTLLFRLPLRMVWHDMSRRLPKLRTPGMHFWHAATNLFATLCSFNSKNWSANGSNNWCSSENQRRSDDERIFMS